MPLLEFLFLSLILSLSYAVVTANQENFTIEHQDFDLAPPFPILEIGFRYILGQIGENSSKVENESISRVLGVHGLHPRPSLNPTPTSVGILLDQKVGPVQCSATVPCLE